MGGVTPKPPAEFSALAITRSMALVATISSRWSVRIRRPGDPKISPTKRIFMPWPSTRRRVLANQSRIGYRAFGGRGHQRAILAEHPRGIAGRGRLPALHALLQLCRRDVHVE